jgi:ABC-type multidrug transport system fused ATPase/permease subunit
MVIEGFLQLKLTNIFIVKSFEYQNKSLATAIEAIESIYTVATLGIEDKVIKEYDSKLKISLKYDMQGTVIQSLLFSIAQSSSTLILACALNVGAYSYTADPPHFTDINDIFRAIGAILYTGLLFKEVFRSLPDTQTAKIAASNILQLLEENPLINATNGRGLDPKTDEKNIKIKLSKVFFSYPSRPGISVLPGLDLNIKHNQTLGIVGPSGCGKSTIISLIERFYDPNAGSIQLNGINSTIFNVSWLRRQMSLVPQEPTLFDMSISDNIRYGALYRDVTDEEIVKAAKDANIHDFIMSLSKVNNSCLINYYYGIIIGLWYQRWP